MTTRILCALCDEHIEFPNPQDISMVADVVSAHGATHGEDWREWGMSIMMELAYSLESWDLRRQLRNN